MLKLRSSTTIELLEYTVPPGESATTAPRNSDQSAAHLGLRVRDVEAAATYLRGVPGVEVLEGPNTIEEGASAGLKWCYFTAPWGLTLELVQLPEGMVV